MKRFKNILVVLDWQKDNSLLINRALNLAERNGSALRLVQVFDVPLESDQDDTIFGKKLNALCQLGIKKSIKSLEDTLNSKNGFGMKLTVSAIQGNHAAEILRTVTAENIDLVMLGLAEDKEELGPLLSGLPLRLMRKCPSAIWTLKPTPLGGFNRIVAAVDPRDQCGEVRALNMKIMEIAVSVAKSEESELHVLHAWSLHGEEVLRDSIDERDLKDWLDREKEKSVRFLAELLKPFEKDIARVHLHKGPADGLLPLFIKHFKADLLVMGTVCRTGVFGFLIGNTAEKILQKVDCSVLTVKLDTFESPSHL
jgi:nucleotide-binding universal stress UspA family protein